MSAMIHVDVVNGMPNIHPERMIINMVMSSWFIKSNDGHQGHCYVEGVRNNKAGIITNYYIIYHMLMTNYDMGFYRQKREVGFGS